MDPEREFLRDDEVAARVGLERATFRKMVAKGQLPQGLLITGGKLKRWRKEDVVAIKYILEFIGTNRLRKSTADEEESDSKDD